MMKTNNYELVMDYISMKKALYQQGINIQNYFEVNNKRYSIYDILEQIHLLPIQLENYNYLFYNPIYLETKLPTLIEFIDAFKYTYNNTMYSYIDNYLAYIKSKYNIRFL